MCRTSLAAVALAVVACDGAKPKPDDVAVKPPPVIAAPTISPKPRFERAPAGDVAALMRERRQRAKADGRQVLVYVGAPWCEPCRYFHDALEHGKLDDTLKGVTFIEFDLDVDKARLVDAGYASKYVPLFAVPDDAGRMTRFIEGSIKGDGAVAEITPRLLRLLEGGR